MLSLDSVYLLPQKRRTSLLVHWFRIHPPVQGKQVRFLVQEDFHVPQGN